MSHARIEEVSDSEPEYDSDPSEDDIEEFDEREIIKARAPKAAPAPRAAHPSLLDPSAVPSVAKDGIAFQSTADEAKYKDFQCIYPIYFDRNRTRKEGRRVGTEGAVENPLAREIVAACGKLGLETLFEPTKMHPKDWANPGRVKVKLKGGQTNVITNSSFPLMSVDEQFTDFSLR
jgi:signal recognition particle subunit SRP19